MGDPGGSELFEQYQTEYNNLTAAVSRKINSQIPTLTGDKKKEVVRAAERELDEADEILDQMDVELRGLPASTRAKLQQRFKTFKSDLSQLRKDLKRVQQTGDRNELLGSTGLNELDRSSADQRQRLLDANARTEASTARLHEARQMAEETVMVGEGIMGDLGKQREQIVNSRSMLEEVNDSLSKSTNILKGMARRVVTNKIIMAIIIIVLLAIIGLIIYLALA